MNTASPSTSAVSRKTFFNYGSIAAQPLENLRALSACCKKQKPIQALDASACEARSVVAAEAAIIYANEIRGKGLDANGLPFIRPDYLLAPLDAATDADTLGTLAGVLVSQLYLDIFMYHLPLVRRIMTDFSDDPGELNQQVSTRKILIPSVVSYNSTLATDGFPTGWLPASPAQTVDVNITLDELIGVPIPFSLSTLSSTKRQLFEEVAPAAAYANAKYYLAKLYALCTAASFNAYAQVTPADAEGIVKVPIAYPTFPCALIDFARSKISDIGAAFDQNEVPDQNRTLLLNASYYNKATTDPSIVTFFAGQAAPEIVTQGVLPDLAGFTPIKAPNFPGSNNQVGIALQKNGLIAKSRLPANLNMVNSGAGNGKVAQIVHPETGMPMMVVEWVNHQRGYSAWLPCAILGAAVGDNRGGLLITNQ